MSANLELVIKAKSDFDAAFRSLQSELAKTGESARRLHEQTKQSKSGMAEFSGGVALASQKLAGLGAAAGLPEAGLRTLNDAAEIAEMGFKNLTTSAAGFNAASMGIIGLGIAIGASIGALANKLEVVRNAADAATGPLYRLAAAMGAVEKGNPNAEKGLADFSAQMAAKNAEAVTRQVAHLKASGVALGEIAKQYAHLNPEMKAHLGLTEQQVKAWETAKKAAQDHAKAVKDLAESLAGDKAAKDLVTLIQAWKKLSAEEKNNEQNIRALVAQYEPLAKRAQAVVPEFEKLAFQMKLMDELGPKGMADFAKQTHASLVQMLQDVPSISKEIEKLYSTDRERIAVEIVDTTQEWSEGLDEVAYALNAVGDATEGTTAKILKGMALAAKTMSNLTNETLQTADAFTKAASAAGGLASLADETSTTQGWLKGAEAGSSFGGFGMLIGAGIGGAWAEYNAYDKRADDALQAWKDLYKMSGERGNEGMDALLKEWGYSLAEFSKLTQDAQAEFVEGLKKIRAEADKVREALVERLQRAMEGLGKWTQSWRDELEKTGTVTAETQEQFDRLGLYAAATFNKLVQETKDLWGALKAIAPTMDNLMEAMTKFGLKGSAAFMEVARLYNMMKTNSAEMDAMSGLLALFEALGNSLMFDANVMNSLTKDVQDLYDKLVGKGLDPLAVLRLMQPLLQKLWEAQHDFGVEVDASTQKLIDQAEQQGLVGDKFRSTEEKILDALIKGLSALIEAVGGKLPEAWAAAAEAAKAYGATQADATGGTPGNVNTEYVPPTAPAGTKTHYATGAVLPGKILPFIPRAASGTYVRGSRVGQPFMLGDGGGDEVAVPVRALFNSVGAAMAGQVAAAVAQVLGDALGAGQEVTLMVGSEPMAAWLERTSRSGHTRVDGAGVRKRG